MQCLPGLFATAGVNWIQVNVLSVDGVVAIRGVIVVLDGKFLGESAAPGDFADDKMERKRINVGEGMLVDGDEFEEVCDGVGKKIVNELTIMVAVLDEERREKELVEGKDIDEKEAVVVLLGEGRSKVEDFS